MAATRSFAIAKRHLDQERAAVEEQLRALGAEVWSAEQRKSSRLPTRIIIDRQADDIARPIIPGLAPLSGFGARRPYDASSSRFARSSQFFGRVAIEPQRPLAANALAFNDPMRNLAAESSN